MAKEKNTFHLRSKSKIKHLFILLYGEKVK